MITNSSTYRLIAAIGFGLVWAAVAVAAEKVKPPAVSVCQNEICLTDLRWSQYRGASRVLVNYSEETLSSISLRFAMKAGSLLVNTAGDNFLGEVPPGGQWAFTANIVRSPNRYLDRTESAVLRCLLKSGGQQRYTTLSFEFDAVLEPEALTGQDIEPSKKGHGKHQQ